MGMIEDIQRRSAEINAEVAIAQAQPIAYGSGFDFGLGVAERYLPDFLAEVDAGQGEVLITAAEGIAEELRATAADEPQFESGEERLAFGQGIQGALHYAMEKRRRGARV